TMAKKMNYAKLYTLRKDGRYQGSYIGADGKQHCVCDRDPERLFQRLEEAKRPKVLTFGEVAEAWKEEHWKKISSGTKACYTASYNRAVCEHRERPVTDVSASDISKHLAKLKAQGLGSKTVKTQRTIYKLIFQFAINDERLGRVVIDNPALNVPLPTGLKSTRREAPADDVIRKIRSNALTAYWGLYAMLLICTGLRRGEALALTWGDIDFKGNTIAVNKSVKYRGTAKVDCVKTEAGNRTVPLLADLKTVLKKPIGTKPEEYVFANTTGGILPEATYRRRWRHYCRDMGFVAITEEKRKDKTGKEYIHADYKSTLTAHVLRHGYATMLFEADVDVYTAQKLLGHSDIKTTMGIYTHLREQKENGSLEKLNNYVANNYKPTMATAMATSK
ncbi:MAG: site-specific integrase, partial [Oscillospiraceae bacterium]